MNAHTGGSAHSTAGFAHPERNLEQLNLDPRMYAADFGAGSGAYVFALAKILTQGHVYAIDIQKDLLKKIHNEAIRKGYSKVDIIWGDIEAPHGSKLADSSIDIVLMSNVLFQVNNKHAPFREAHRILNDTGKLIIIDWSESFGGLGPRREDILEKEAALELSQRESFMLVREFAAGAHHYGLELKKSEVHSLRV